MSLGSIAGRNPIVRPSTARWIGATVAALVLWGIVYRQLVPFLEGITGLLPVAQDSPLGEAIRFFVYDTPKVLMRQMNPTIRCCHWEKLPRWEAER